MKNNLILISLSVILFSCGNEQKDKGLSKDQLQELIAQEMKNQERAKHGYTTLNITTISDAGQVEKLREEIEKKILLKKNKTAAQRYKEGDKSALPEIIKTLKNGNKKEKRAVFFDLQKDYDDKSDYKITEPELLKLILEKIDNPEDEGSAIQLAGFNKLPGALTKFETRLLSGKSTDADRLFYWISEEGTNNTVLHYATDRILSGKIDLEKDNYFMGGLESFAEKGTPQMREHVLKTCYEIKDKKLISAEKFEDIKTSYSSDNPAIDLLNILLKYGDKKVVPIALDLLKQGVFEEQALEALVKLEGAKHKDLVLKGLRDKKKFFQALPAVILLYKTSADKSVVEEMLTQFEKTKEPEQYKTDRVVEALVKMGATDYFNKLESVLKNKQLIADMTRSYQLSKITMQEVAADITAMGLTDKPIDTKLFVKEKNDNEDDADKVFATDLLSKLGIYMFFDAETGMVPVDYDKLILDFATHSNGKFKDPLVWMDAKENPADQTYKYKITMIYNNKAYIIEPEDIGDWYDVEMLTGFINKALAESGVEEKFVSIETGDQTVQYIFGKEENVKKFAKKYQLY